MYAEHNQPELALMDLDKAVELDSTNMNYVLARAYLYQQQGNNHRAKQDFDRAIELGMPAQMLKKERKSTHRTP
jgi:Tfp pilus assembly protein PilF